MELERATARERSNTERVSELEARIAAAGAELEQTRTQLAGIEEERAQQRSFLETAAGEAHEFRQKVEARQHEARAAAEEVFTRGAGTGERVAATPCICSRSGNARNYIAQGEESLAALEREAERLEAEMGQARNEQENLGVESGESRLRFEAAGEALRRLEHEIAALRETLQARRGEENARAGARQPAARRTGGGRRAARFAATR